MPLYIDLSTEAAASTLITQAFINDVKRNIGFDPETPDSELPVDIVGLINTSMTICEKEQWRFLLRKTANLSLPYEAFLAADRLLVLPFGRVTSLTTFIYKKYDGTTANISSANYTVYPHEPSKLWCKDWSALFTDIDNDQPYPITVAYQTGYSSFSEIPRSTVQAIKILAYHLYEFRDAVSDNPVSELPQGYCALRDHNLLNDMRAIKYVAEDWSKVSRG